MGDIFYPDGFHVEMDMIPETGDTGAFAVIAGMYMLFMCFYMLFVVALYVVQSLGYYTIAKRRGIRNGWLAWLPIGNLWIAGSISDQYQYVTKGKVKNRRKTLLGLSIALLVLYIGMIIVLVIGILISESLGSDAGAALAVLLTLLSCFAVIGIAIATLVFQYICLYDLYKSCNPDDAGLFLVLSILFSLAMPFFIFACRKKDLGMPPRRQPAPEQVVVPTVEVVVDPNVVEKVVVPTVEPVTEEGFAQPEEFEEE